MKGNLIMKNIYKIIVNFHENTKDYVSCDVYSILDDHLFELDDIRKPENVVDYNDNWKNGLIEHYKSLAKNRLPKHSQIINI